jgi:DNA repair exonuclease SbcCD ATPase subunit
MIRRLTLKNWRNYEDVTVELGVGTTFVVASNGMGKTSLVEAARWALFGTTVPGGNTAIRAGAASALAIVELELPDQRVLSVERTLVGKPRSATPLATVRLDGAPVPHEELDQHLISAYRAEPGLLAGLTMPAVYRDRDKPSALGLEEHLGQFYGIGGLRSAAEQLKAKRKAIEARIKRTKNANSTNAQRLAQLHGEVEQTARQAAEAAEGHKAIQDRVHRAQERDRLDADMKKWQDKNSAWTEAVERLAARISSDFGGTVAVGSVEGVLDERLAHLDQQIETVRVESAVNAAKEAALTANQERLDAAHDDCPVCRRPLDDTTVALAHEANMHELSAIRDSIRELSTTESDLRDQRERVKALLTEWRRIPQPGEPPQAPPQAPVAGDEPFATAQLAAMAESALGALVEARAAHAQATRELDEARDADKAMRELESLFRQEASLRVAAEATELTLRELLDETIRPLAAEIDQRWKALFPDRGALDTHSDGSITRTINGYQLSYDSFSTGESMSTTILVRLLVTLMATAADFCWFDEPLEHLDPDVRRKVASLLSRVTSEEGRLKQVVVTTYEEPLARQLQARDEQRVTLLDVRQAG